MSEMEAEGCVERWELKQEKTKLPSFDVSGFSPLSVAALWKLQCLEHPTRCRYMLQAVQCSVDLTELPQMLEMKIQIRDRVENSREDNVF